MYLFILGKSKGIVFYISTWKYCNHLSEVFFNVVLYFLQLSWDCWVSWTSCLSTMPVTASSPEEPQSSLFLDLRFVALQFKLNSCLLSCDIMNVCEDSLEMSVVVNVCSLLWNITKNVSIINLNNKKLYLYSTSQNNIIRKLKIIQK